MVHRKGFNIIGFEQINFTGASNNVTNGNSHKFHIWRYFLNASAGHMWPAGC